MAKFFINRPIVSMVISIIMVLVGAFVMFTLPTAQFPNITPPDIQVKATYPGADSLTVEQSVAAPIEQQMSGVDNMNYMYSINANNSTLTLTVDFDVKTDPNTDQILTQMREGQAASQLPSDVNNYGVTVQKSTAAPLMLFDLYSPDGRYSAEFLANYAYINLNDQFTRVPGIASVTVFGAGQYAMRLWVKPDKLSKLQITIPDIIKAIQAQNNVNPAGQIGGEPVPPGQEFTYAVTAQGRLTTEEQFGAIVIRHSTAPESPMSFEGAALNTRRPMLSSALGRVWLAFCPDEERRTILRDIGGLTRRQAAALDEVLARVRRDGVAFTQPPRPTRVHGMAVPIRRNEGVLGSLSIRFPRSAMTEEEVRRRFGKRLQVLARAIATDVARRLPS